MTRLVVDFRFALWDYMTLNETLAVTGTTSAQEAPPSYSAAWWGLRSADELRDIINRGFAGGQTFNGALAETERRARAATRRLREEAAIAAEIRRKRKKLVSLGALATIVTIVASVGIWFVR
jgi:ribosomal protein S19E (S16A)